MDLEKKFVSGREITFAADEVIVSKTDLTGHITYANDVFMRVAKYEEHEVIGQPHSLVRHPHMPRAVFKLLWDTINQGQEIFAYVLNRCKDGDEYWVLAHVTPIIGADGKVAGYHSSRRKPEQAALAKVKPLYKKLLAIEQAAPDRKIGLAQSFDAVVAVLREANLSYEEFVYGL